MLKNIDFTELYNIINNYSKSNNIDFEIKNLVTLEDKFIELNFNCNYPKCGSNIINKNDKQEFKCCTRFYFSSSNSF